ncbi:MAG: FdtA/QdtA family cupin domain-containing protein [Paramuribaculum sp.]|nr:FdtA/QdtA family cupin domain-containing protein [Paramuribaculum sp.]
MALSNPTIINVGKISDPRGNMSVLAYPGCMPFSIVRTDWIHGLPCGVNIGGNAYYKNEQLIVALSGVIDITVSRGEEVGRFTLSRADVGLYIPPMTWCEISTASTNAVMLIVSSTLYSPTDEILDRDSFNNIIRAEDVRL